MSTRKQTVPGIIGSNIFRDVILLTMGMGIQSRALPGFGGFRSIGEADQSCSDEWS